MERIEEEILKRNTTLSVDDPYVSAISIMEAARKTGKVNEKINKFLTSGPRKKCEVSFTFSDIIDKNSRTFFTVDMNGEANGTKKLVVSINAVFQVKLPSREGFAKEAFAEYYMKKIMPQSRAISKTRAAFFENEIKRILAKEIAAVR